MKCKNNVFKRSLCWKSILTFWMYSRFSKIIKKNNFNCKIFAKEKEFKTIWKIKKVIF